MPDVDDVRRWMQEMIKSLRFGELVVAIVAFVVRMRDLNTELTKRLGALRRGRPRSETLRHVQNQLALNFAAVTISVVYEDDENEDDSSSATADATSPRGGPPFTRYEPSDDAYDDLADGAPRHPQQARGRRPIHDLSEVGGLVLEIACETGTRVGPWHQLGAHGAAPPAVHPLCR